MTYASQSCIYGRIFMATLLAALKTVATGPLIASPKLRLSKDPSYNPTPDSTIAALAAMEADFTGYTAGGVAATLSVPLQVNTTVSGVLATNTFQAGTATPFVNATVYGWWMDDGTNFVAGEKFANGFVAPMSGPGVFLGLQALLFMKLYQP